MKGFWKSVMLPGALIVVLTVVAYTPALRGGFVWDDDMYITHNEMVKDRDGLYRLWFTTGISNYYPLTSSLWWLEWRMWGGCAAGYHVVNVLLHAVNAVLVWIVLRRLRIRGAWLAALVFAIHPVNVGTVAWISELKNTLSMFFYAMTIVLYLRFDEEGRWSWYGLSLAAFLLALLSKTAVAMLPIVLLGCRWWLHGQVRRKDVLYSLPFFVLSMSLGLVTIWFEHYRVLEQHPARMEGFLSRLASAGCVPWFYLYKALLPLDLIAIYPKWTINASVWFSYLPGTLLVGGLALFWWKRRTWGRPLFFGVGYFAVALFPVLGFIDIGFNQYSLVADHWQYYSIIGPIALAVAAAASIWRRLGEWGQAIGVLASVGVLTVLGAATWIRADVYTTAETLWQDTVARNPNAWVAHNNLANELSSEGRVQEAIGHYEQALRIKPDYVQAHNNLGVELAGLGRFDDAIKHFEQALRVEPDNQEAHNNLAFALLKVGKIEEGIKHLEQAVRINPNSAEGHCNLANALVQAGRIEDALGHYEQAVQLKPDFAQAHNSLGIAFERLGRTPEAKDQYEQALRLEPDYAEAHHNLGVLLSKADKGQEAQDHYEEALRLRPDSAKAHHELGVLLASTGRTEEAISEYRKALQDLPDYAEVRNDLGAALVSQGKLDEAVSNFTAALQLAPNYAGAHYNLGVVLARQGKTDKAISHLQSAVRLEPGSETFQRVLSRLQAAKARPETR